jgi:hypothetical protein
MEDDANSIGHYIFDETYVEEDGNVSICSERSGSEVDHSVSNSDIGSFTKQFGDGVLSINGNYIRHSGATTSTIYYLDNTTLTAGSKISLKYQVIGNVPAENGVYIYKGIGGGSWTSIKSFSHTDVDEIIDLGAGYDSIRIQIRDNGNTYSSFDISTVEIYELPANSLLPSGFSDGFEDEYADGGALITKNYIDNKTDSNSDGLSDGWFSLTGTATATRVTGNGFTGYAQRAYCDSTSNCLLSDTSPILKGGYYKVSFKYRSNNGIGLYFWGATDGNKTLGANTGAAIESITYHNATNNAINGNLRFYIRSSAGDAQTGDWIEIDDMLVEEVAQENPAYENGGVLKFNGVDQSLNGGDVHDMGTGDFTLEAWIKCADYSAASVQVICSKYEDINNRWNFHIDTNGELALASVASGAIKTNANTTGSGLTNGQWHHVAVTVDRGTAVQFYIDGTAYATTELTNLADNIDNTGDFRIGQFGDNSLLFDGYIAEVRISDSARTLMEIRQSYGIPKSWQPNGGDTFVVDNDDFNVHISNTTAVDDGFYIEPSSLEIGALYKMTLTAKTASGETWEIRFDGINFFENYSNENYTTYATYLQYAGNSTLRARCSSAAPAEAWFSEIRLQKVINAETPDDGFVEDFSLGGAKYGSNLLTNGDFHDFTMEDDGNVTAHWIFDKSYTAEDGLLSIMSERQGSESNSLTGDSKDFTSGLGDWGPHGSATLANANNAMQITLNSSGTSGARMDTAITIGKIYYVSIQARVLSGSKTTIDYVGDDAAVPASISLSGLTSTMQTFTGYFQPTDVDLYIACDSSDGSVIEIDNFTLLELPTNSLQPIGFSTGFVDEYQTSGSPVYQSGGVLDFNGSSEVLNGGNILNLGTGAFTIEAWIKMDDYASARSVICNKYELSVLRWHFEVNASGELEFYARTAVGAQITAITNTTPFTNGQWHHVAVVTDRTSHVSLYVDGVDQTLGTETYSAVDLDNTADFILGAYGGAAFHFDGQIAEVRISDTERSAQDILQSYGRARNWLQASGNLDLAENDGFAQKFSMVGSGTFINQTFSTVDGSMYRLTWDGIASANSAMYVQVRNGASGVIMGARYFTTSQANYTGYFQGDGSTCSMVIMVI